MKVIWTYIIIAIALLCCYSGVYHAHHYYDSLVIVIGLVGIICSLALQMMWFEGRNLKWKKFRTFLFLILVTCPITFGVYYLQRQYCQKQLKNHGIIAYARVTELFTRKHKNGVTHYAKFEYTINGKIWFQKLVNRQSRFELNDSLKIRCSSEEPEIFELIALKKYWE
jgi:hypothetical protein